MKQILVLHRGWVIIGNVSKETQNEIEVQDCSVIRKWGTTKGLGEIALNGITKETVLDPCGTVIAPLISVIMRIQCKV